MIILSIGPIKSYMGRWSLVEGWGQRPNPPCRYICHADEPAMPINPACRYICHADKSAMPINPPCQYICHADRLASFQLARCRGIRRMHLNSNMSAREQAPVSQFGSSAHGSLLRAKKGQKDERKSNSKGDFTEGNRRKHF